MRREAQIPLFLWVATALVVHGIGGEGASVVAHQVEEASRIKSFASQVRRQAHAASKPVEVTLIDESQPDEEEVPALNPPSADETEEQSPEQVDEAQAQDKPKPEEKPAPQAEEKLAEEKAQPEAKKDPSVPDLTIQKPQQLDNRRVAVDQEVEDKNQQDNPNAEFAGEHANHVEEQTQAQITAQDGSTSKPQLGGPSVNSGSEPGNSEEEKFGQSDESEGRKDLFPDQATNPDQSAKVATAPPPSAAPAQPASQQQPQPTPPPPQEAQQARAAQDAQDAVPETLTSESGRDSVAQAQAGQAASKAQQAQKAIPGRPKRSQPMFGLGSQGTSINGYNLNLSMQSAQAIIGADNMQRIRKESGERRLAQHRGKWESLGIERWKPALNNYVAGVKPGNQTALNTAAVPFARYLNQIHQRLHVIFADRFLGHLDELPKDHPLNNMNMSTNLEVVLSPEDGRVVRMGVTKSSGVTAFDVGALDSVQRAAPYGPPPGSIVSSDGNVYLHWEFHRRPEYACSTYFARPFILDLGQKSAPPTVQPPRPSDEKPKQNTENKSGAITRERDEPQKPG